MVYIFTYKSHLKEVEEVMKYVSTKLYRKIQLLSRTHANDSEGTLIHRTLWNCQHLKWLCIN